MSTAEFFTKVPQHDPVRTQGLGPKLRTLATRKTEELDAAYAWATRAHSGG